MKAGESILDCIKRVSKEVLRNPLIIVPKLAGTFWVNWIPDEIYLKISFKANTGKTLNLNNPQTFNEKLQWLKLYDKNPKYTRLVDKLEVRKYVEDTVGEKYLIPILGVWDSTDEIDFEKLPDQFVLKCTHDSGGVIVCTDKKTFDCAKALKKLKKSMRKNYFYCGREWPYKNVKPRIIAEQYMVDESKTELKDYKIFTMNGMCKYIQVDFDRFCGHKRNIYDLDWDIMDFEIKYPSDQSRKIKKPEQLEEMIRIAEALADGIPQVRVDLYILGNGEIKFGELTLFHGSGMEEFRPDIYNKIFGDMIKIC